MNFSFGNDGVPRFATTLSCSNSCPRLYPLSARASAIRSQKHRFSKIILFSDPGPYCGTSSCKSQGKSHRAKQNSTNIFIAVGWLNFTIIARRGSGRGRRGDFGGWGPLARGRQEERTVNTTGLGCGLFTCCLHRRPHCRHNRGARWVGQRDNPCSQWSDI